MSAPIIYANSVIARYRNKEDVPIPVENGQRRLSFAEKQRLIRLYDERIARMTQKVRFSFSSIYHARLLEVNDDTTEREYIPESERRNTKAIEEAMRLRAEQENSERAIMERSV